jgi:hypothetical protein
LTCFYWFWHMFIPVFLSNFITVSLHITIIIITLSEIVGRRVPNRNFRLSVGMSTLNIETAVPRNAVRQELSSTVITIYSMDVRSNLKWLANIPKILLDNLETVYPLVV